MAGKKQNLSASQEKKESPKTAKCSASRIMVEL